VFTLTVKRFSFTVKEDVSTAPILSHAGKPVTSVAQAIVLAT